MHQTLAISCLILTLLYVQFALVQAFLPPLPSVLSNLLLKKSLTLKMSALTGKERIMKAFEIAFRIKPAVGGFPYLAEILHRAGVEKNYWTLPGCTSLYQTKFGDYVQNIPPLVPEGINPIASFNRDLVIKAIRDDQAGKTTFPEFLVGIWEAGIVKYDVDFNKRIVIYYGINSSDFYEEKYPKVYIAEDIEGLLSA